jgi:prolyl oligopeptidase
VYAQEAALNYPDTPAQEYSENLHGTAVHDRFRWLEQDISDNAAVDAWVDAQNLFTTEYLEQHTPTDIVRQRLTELWNYERYGVPEYRAGRYFYTYNSGLQDHDVLYVQDESDVDARVLIDPNSWNLGEASSMGSYFPSPDGKHLAFLEYDSGSDWQSARVISTESLQFLDDSIEGLRFTELSWAPDSSGFFYSSFPEGTTEPDGDSGQTLYFHRLGSGQTEDRAIFARAKSPEWGYTTSVSDDGQFLIIQIWIGSEQRYEIAYLDLTDSSAEPQLLITGFEYNYTPIGTIDREILFLTDQGAPRKRVIAIDVDRPDITQRRTVIPQATDALESVHMSRDRLVASYLNDAASDVRVFDFDGRFEGRVELPTLGAATGFVAHSTISDVYFRFTSLSTPSAVYKLNTLSMELNLHRQPKVDFDSNDYVVERVFFEGKDRTQIPMFLARHKDTELDGNTPTLLFGYGGFGLAQRPVFTVPRIAWMEMGGVFALANVRGGGEYGEEWHLAGTGARKQTVFDDFISAADFLIESGVTNSSRLGMRGISNGGLSVGAVMTQRPDLLSVALPIVAPLDMVRFDRFSGGKFWVDEFGSPGNPEEFNTLFSYSPYHRIVPETDYPATLVITADTDDRVAPAHSYKFVAALQAAQSDSAPILLRVHRQTGHGGGMSTAQLIDEFVDMWSLLAATFEMQLEP